MAKSNDKPNSTGSNKGNGGQREIIKEGQIPISENRPKVPPRTKK